MSILDSYQRKARITTTMLNSLEGVSCNAVTGSLYAFPKIVLPQKAIEEAMVRHQRGLVSVLYYGIFPPFTQKPTTKIWLHLEACVAERLTSTSDLETRGSSLARRVVSLEKKLYSTLFTQVYKRVLAAYCWGVTLRWTSIPSRREQQYS